MPLSRPPLKANALAYSDQLDKCLYLAIVGGGLLILGGVSSFNALEILGFSEGDMIKVFTEFGGRYGGSAIAMLFMALNVLSLIGGFVVILGGVTVHRNRLRVGRILIDLGAGLGLFGVIILLIVTVATLDIQSIIVTVLGLTFIGTLISLVARKMAPKVT